MSDLMDRAVVTMPYDLAMSDELSRMQFWSRVQLVYKEQFARIEADEALMRDARRALFLLHSISFMYRGIEVSWSAKHEDALKQAEQSITTLCSRLETGK